MTLLQSLAQELSALRLELLEEGELLSETQLKGFYATFRERFGPEALARLDGEMLLETMHLHSKESLVYWLEFKNDDEFPTSKFGGIGGGTALKFCIYRGKESGEWITGSPQQKQIITVEQAIEEARKHRDELTDAAALVDRLPEDGSDADYRTLQDQMNAVAPHVAQLGWGHKYLSLLYPDKLDDYHAEEWQRYQLVRLLQVPPAGAGRYVAAGRFVALARELGMPLNHITNILTRRNGGPRRYWRVGTRDGSTGQSHWDTMRQSRFVAIGWTDLGDLSWVRLNQQSKNRLRELIQASYPNTPQAEGRTTQQIFNFIAAIGEGDVVLASDGAAVMGIGRVTGPYQFDAAAEFPHRRPVEWLDLDRWSLPTPQGLRTTVHELGSIPANLVEVERRILGGPPPPPPKAPTPPPLSGIAGRVHAILERKGQVILYGPPGTGKTYWAQAAAYKLAELYGATGPDDGSVRTCTFHPSYGYEDFLEGYRPIVKGDQMVFERRDGIFKTLCKQASASPDRRFYLIVDEINRGDVPRIFGELLTVLEKDKRDRPIQLALSGESFRMPDNVYLIGTMNTADRSIALLDAALRRRFGFIELMPDSAVLGTASVEGILLGPWLDALNRRVREHAGREARNLQIGHAYFLEADGPVTRLDRFAQIFRDDVIPLLEEYTYEDYAALQKILGSTLVDGERQRIREELFEPSRQTELVNYLNAFDPEMATSPQAVQAEAEASLILEPNDQDGLEHETATPE